MTLAPLAAVAHFPGMRARSAVLSLGVTVAMATGPVPARDGLRSPVGARCGAAIAGTLTEWASREQWRPLAPVPAPRDATPTAVPGVWIERWQRGDTTELRRVSAESTVVMTFAGDACVARTTTHVRTYDRAALASAFTDDSLRALLRRSPRGMVYVWSPRMPLSVAGIAEARAASRTLGIDFTAVVAESNDGELASVRVNAADARAMESVELVYRNATIHYPAVVLYHDGAIVDGVLPGVRHADGYARLVRDAFARDAAAHATRAHRALARDDDAHDAPRNSPPSFWLDTKAVVTTVSVTPTPRRIGFFFKPVTGTNLISYTAGEATYLFDLATRKEQRIPGHVDPVPTPDGRFITLPGLAFHPLSSLLTGDNAPLFVDEELPDEYQTASIFKQSRTGVRYRVITGWQRGPRFRDYDVTFGNGKVGAPGATDVVTPLGTPFAPCDGRTLSLPINAKNGQEFGAYDGVTTTNVVVRVTDAHTCTTVLDLGFATGKLTFSYDGARIAFATSRINVDGDGPLLRPSETFWKDALVLHRRTGRLVSLSHNQPIFGMTFPEFRSDGAVMLLEQGGPGRPQETIRVVTVK